MCTVVQSTRCCICVLVTENLTQKLEAMPKHPVCAFETNSHSLLNCSYHMLLESLVKSGLIEEHLNSK